MPYVGPIEVLEISGAVTDQVIITPPSDSRINVLYALCSGLDGRVTIGSKLGSDATVPKMATEVDAVMPGNRPVSLSVNASLVVTTLGAALITIHYEIE